jgi:membrane protease YdiL (CAAX protease family)
MDWTYLDLFTGTVIVFLAVIMPVFGVWEHRRMNRLLAEGVTTARVDSYRLAIVVEWFAAIGMLVWWMVEKRPAEPLFLTLQIEGWQLVIAAVAVVLTAVVVIQTKRDVNNPAALEKVRGSIGSLESMVPRTPKEVTAFNVLSVTAGICEEIMYRGVLMAVLASLLGWWPAVVVGGVIFGLAHAYQGCLGIVKTGILGMLMSVLTIFSGTLVPAILLHVVIDLSSGKMMAAALLGDRKTSLKKGD